MCLIIVVEKKPPTLEELELVEIKNPDGIGLGFFKNKQPNFLKGLTLEKAWPIIRGLKPPYVIHFRLASTGWTNNCLGHPFPIEPVPSLKLSGGGKKRLLFHNGTWATWKSALLSIAAAAPEVSLDFKGDKELWSDTRVMASMFHFAGPGVEDYIDVGRLAIMEPDGTITRHGEWVKAKGIGWTSKDMEDTRWCHGGRQWIQHNGFSYRWDKDKRAWYRYDFGEKIYDMPNKRGDS